MSSASLGALDVQLLLDALGSPIRREILWLIWDTELAAGRIGAAFDLTAPTISAHLGILRRAGLVTVRAEQNHRYYRAEHQAVRRLQGLIAAESGRWIPMQPPPEPAAVTHATDIAVRVAVDVPCDRTDAFMAMTSADQFSTWLGVPVTLDRGRFATTLEWGTRVRGQFEIVVAPELIVLRWDFDDGVVPLPGRELTAYVRFSPREHGSRVQVQQLVSTTDQGEFMHIAWGFVLGRFAEHFAR